MLVLFSSSRNLFHSSHFSVFRIVFPLFFRLSSFAGSLSLSLSMRFRLSAVCKIEQKATRTLDRLWLFGPNTNHPITPSTCVCVPVVRTPKVSMVPFSRFSVFPFPEARFHMQHRRMRMLRLSIYLRRASVLAPWCQCTTRWLLSGSRCLSAISLPTKNGPNRSHVPEKGNRETAQRLATTGAAGILDSVIRTNRSLVD